MRVKKIFRAIEKGRIGTFLLDEPQGEPRSRLFKELEIYRDSLRHAQRFLLEIDDLEKPEIDASAAAMYEMDIFRLPYKICYTELSVMLQNEVRHSDKVKAVISLISTDLNEVGRQVVDPFSAASFLSKVMVNIPDIDGPNTYRFVPGTYVHGPYGLVQFNPIKGIKIPDNYQSSFIKLGDGVADTISSLVVLLETKGVDKEYIQTHKTNLVSRDFPVDGYTVVRNYRAKTSSGQIIEERKRVRLHLRRGHVRRQHWGRGNKWEKKIWIEPTLVGYEEEGWIEHDYEVDKV